jgi:hypothetical protein
VVVLLAGVGACSATSHAASRVEPTVTTAATRPSSTTTPTTRATPGPAAKPKLHPIVGGVTALGDSVMIDAAPALRAMIPGIDVDAAVNRSALPGPSILASRAAAGTLHAAILFDLGTNGGFSADLLNRVLRVAAGRRVVIVTNHCPYCSWTNGQNALMRVNCRVDRRCFVADWDALARAHPAWFGGDGVHMPIDGPGARAYAQLVREKL